MAAKPLIVTGAQLPPGRLIEPGARQVPTEALRLEALRARFADAQAGRLPSGWMHPELRDPREAAWGDQPWRQAAVLLGLQAPRASRAEEPHHYPHLDPDWQVIFTRRSDRLTHHPGQVSLPGGRVEASDASTTAAALREAQEEVGLPAQGTEPLGLLPRYRTGTGFEITPVVALLPPDFQPQAQPQEVVEVFAVPLAHLLNPEHHRLHELEFEGRRHAVLSIAPEPGSPPARLIWGATAALLHHFYRFLLA